MARARRPEGNREKLLRGAIACLRDKGYARTTARDIVDASGANLASIGYHYGSVEALLNEAVAVGFHEWTGALEREAVEVEATTSRERLTRTLSLLVDRYDELRPFLTAFVEAFPQAVRSPELRDRLADAYAEARAAGADMIMRSLEEAEIEISRARAENLASVFTALSDGLLLQWLLDEQATPSSSEVLEALELLSDIAASRTAAG